MLGFCVGFIFVRLGFFLTFSLPLQYRYLQNQVSASQNRSFLYSFYYWFNLALCSLHMKSLVPVGPLEMPLVSLRQQTAKKISKALSKMLLSLFMHPVTKLKD